MSTKGFVMYNSYLVTMKELTDSELGRLVRAAMEYNATGTVGQLTGNERFLFETVKFQIDNDSEKYRSKCEKNKQNAGKRWGSSDKDNADVCDGMRPHTKDANINENEKVNVNLDKNIFPNGNIQKKTCTQKIKEPKKAYGNAKNVFLTDEQHTKLIAEYGGSLLEMVEHLSDYIAVNGKKYKDHYRVLNGWVKDAVREKKLKQKELEVREERLKTGYSYSKTEKHHKLAEKSDNPDDWR